jgi:hypothetical protein
MAGPDHEALYGCYPACDCPCLRTVLHGRRARDGKPSYFAVSQYRAGARHLDEIDLRTEEVRAIGPGDVIDAALVELVVFAHQPAVIAEVLLLQQLDRRLRLT